MLRLLKPLSVSAAASPSTALPVMIKALDPPVKAPLVVTVLAVSVVLAPKVTAPLKICVPLVVTALASVLVPVTSKLEVPVLLVTAGPVPLMLKLPTVIARCKSNVALLMVSALLLLPKLPLLVTTKLPAFTVVLPP